MTAKPVVRPARAHFSSGPCAKRPGYDLSTLPTDQFGIEGIAIVQDGTASVLGHNDIHIIRFSVNHKLYLVSFLAHQRHIGYAVSNMYFHTFA